MCQCSGKHTAPSKIDLPKRNNFYTHTDVIELTSVHMIRMLLKQRLYVFKFFFFFNLLSLISQIVVSLSDI